ncbi:CAA Xprenyl protease [Schizosaccharomyces cryophilus OY26]|uniref:CAAX prenyl protease n=1 Tax=Schizosaccharomyces cryophilus (strain OY26 / ATCC MYA-4695 / CBS 11777 / NBRC 106824 / NRRL Y48691) TaxID=653667 RepID=S9X6Z1_SCHCR|nr:CAA Xprenyl protease [Schizosaccharomyces cryophilus OY26]EPY52822.1 CAA Xprenyl protease [Schizosaccharomyces cryophilus OY26]
MGLVQQIMHVLDFPGFPWKTVIASFSIGKYVWDLYLQRRQAPYLLKESPPTVLAEHVDEEKYQKALAYARDKTFMSTIVSTFALVTDLLLIKFNGLSYLWNATKFSWMDRLAASASKFSLSVPISHSCVFLFALTVYSCIIQLPFSLYSTFGIEEKYGFNKSTPKIFFMDMFKELTIGGVLMSLLVSTFVKITMNFGDNFVLYAWGAYILFGLVLQSIAPSLIMPLFFKFTPLEQGSLRTKIEKLAASIKFPLKKLYVVDASRRSAHSNAFFYGLPWNKGIVLFDTLVKNHTEEELLAILGHELGHWYLSHNLIHTLVDYGMSLAQLFMFAAFLRNNSLYEAFDFTKEKPVIIGLLLFSDALGPVSSLLTFGSNKISRFCEYQADAYAKKLGLAKDLGDGLIRIHNDNLSPLEYDSLYTSYHHSHPILTDRLDAIDYMNLKKNN